MRGMADDLADKKTQGKDATTNDKTFNGSHGQERREKPIGSSGIEDDRDGLVDDIQEGIMEPIAELLDRSVDTVSDAVGDAGLSIEKISKALLRLVSEEDEPENNVHFVHPVSGNTVALGLHIAKDDYGCVVTHVEEEGYASKFKIEKGDIIRTINGTDLRGYRIGDIIKLLSGLDLNEGIVFRVVRVKKNEEGEDYLYEIDVTVKIKTSDDKVNFDFEVTVTATYLRFWRVSNTKYIRQGPLDSSTVYLRVNDGNQTLISTEVDDNCHFVMELYQGDAFGRNICVIRHEQSDRVIKKTTDAVVGAVARSTQSSTTTIIIGNSDHEFFYWIKPTQYPGEDVFQSVLNNQHFLAVGDDDTPCLKTFGSVGEVDSSARFIVQDV